jgi:hypothetical protein
MRAVAFGVWLLPAPSSALSRIHARRTKGSIQAINACFLRIQSFRKLL